jgi:diacylglycerol kinase (ATP)
VRFIINPAAGQDEPILNTINRALQGSDIRWDVGVTLATGDAARLTKEAVEAGYDVVAAYGGDGTIMEVASGLAGSEVPLAILPGGTANVISVELGIPRELEAACMLLLDKDAPTQAVDLGLVGEHYFMLRLGIGFEAEMVAGAERDLKNRLGILAYAVSALKSLRETPVSQYRLELDGEEVECEGISCMIANSGNLAIGGMTLAPNISVSDGLLDVVVIRNADLEALIAIANSIRGINPANEAAESLDEEAIHKSLQHWQVKKVRVEADPPQTIQADGEIIGSTPIQAEIIPKAVRVIIPRIDQ